MALATTELSKIETTPARLKMSYEEFLDWAGDDTHAEWVNGEVILFMPVKDVHQAVLGFLNTLMILFTTLFDLGKIRTAPYAMRAVPGGSAREPDLLFVAKEHLDRVTEDRLVGPADLIIEIVSDDSVSRDRDDKFKEYRAAGVREYWIIDPRPGKQRADFFRLDDNGDYRLFATEDDEQVASQVISGFWLKPAWLWQADALNPLTCALQIEGVAEAVTQQIEQLQTKGV
jgi:Uma2 family endonuclease